MHLILLVTHLLSLFVVYVILLLAIETCDALGHARNGDLAGRLDPLLIKFSGSHFRLHICCVSEVMLVHEFCIFI